MRILASVLLLAASTAHADTPADQPATQEQAKPIELGVRVGGYGFHREGTNEWDLCRMNGFGVVGQRAIASPLFVEAGVDVYSSVPERQPGDLPLDRESGLFTAAIGARTQPWSWFRAYAQLGGGVELASVSVPYGDTRIRDTKTLPVGFLGLGVDFKIFRRTYLGMSIRTLVMGNFDYETDRLDPDNMWVAKPTAETVFQASPARANQGQFSLRYEL